MLDSRFSKEKKLKKKYDLLVTFGGFDEKNVSDLIIKKLSNSNYNFKVRLILGPAYDQNRIKHIKNTNDISLDIIKQTNNLQKEIAQSKFVICSGGVTTYEICNMKIPFAIICQVKHQILTAKEWEKKFDEEQRLKEEELVEKFYSDEISKQENNQNGDNLETKTDDDNLKN